MKRARSKTEREELKSLKQDLVGPVKRFMGEVYGDTVGDAKKFYAAQARQAQKKARLVQQRTEEQMAFLAQRRAAQQKRRKASMKRTAIILALVILIGILFISLALSARAEEPGLAACGEACRTGQPRCAEAEQAYPRAGDPAALRPLLGSLDLFSSWI